MLMIDFLHVACGITVKDDETPKGLHNKFDSPTLEHSGILP